MGFKVVLLAQGWNSSKPTLSVINALGQLVSDQSSYLFKNQILTRKDKMPQQEDAWLKAVLFESRWWQSFFKQNLLFTCMSSLL